jgi:hypothetical protein
MSCLFRHTTIAMPWNGEHHGTNARLNFRAPQIPPHRFACREPWLIKWPLMLKSALISLVPSPDNPRPWVSLFAGTEFQTQSYVWDRSNRTIRLHAGLTDAASSRVRLRHPTTKEAEGFASWNSTKKRR